MYDIYNQDDCIKPKFGDKAKLCYMHTDSLVIHIFTEDFFEDIVENDVENGLIHLTMRRMTKDRF